MRQLISTATALGAGVLMAYYMPLWAALLAVALTAVAYRFHKREAKHDRT